jgi:osmotically-inducible protein OsmY
MWTAATFAGTAPPPPGYFDKIARSDPKAPRRQHPMSNRDFWRDEDDDNRSYRNDRDDWRSRSRSSEDDNRRRGASWDDNDRSRYSTGEDSDERRADWDRQEQSGYGREDYARSSRTSQPGSQYGQREWDENGYRARRAGDWDRSSSGGTEGNWDRDRSARLSSSSYYDRPERGEASTGYGGSGRYGYATGTSRQSFDDRGYGHHGERRQERGWLDKAADEVSSWFGDEAAARRREADARGQGPKNYTRSADRIREDVNDRLTDDPIVDARDLEVTVSGTEVTLAGTVTSRDQRRRAEDIAEGVTGVTHVQNNLRVGPGSMSAQQTTGYTQSATGIASTTGSTSGTALNKNRSATTSGSSSRKSR